MSQLLLRGPEKNASKGCNANPTGQEDRRSCRVVVQREVAEWTFNLHGGAQSHAAEHVTSRNWRALKVQPIGFSRCKAIVRSATLCRLISVDVLIDKVVSTFISCCLLYTSDVPTTPYV